MIGLHALPASPENIKIARHLIKIMTLTSILKTEAVLDQGDYDE